MSPMSVVLAALATGPLLDEDLLVELEAFGDGFLAELTDAFEDQAAAVGRDISAALRDDDAEAIHRLAHTMKGSAGTLGAARAAAWAAELDTLARTGTLVGAGILASGLDDATAACIGALRARVAGEPS